MKRKKVSKREGAMIEVFDLVSLDIDFIKSLKNLREDLDKDSPVPLNYLLEFNGETVKINYIPTENQKFMVRDFRNGGKHGNHEKEVESTADWVSLRTVDSNKPFCSGSIPFKEHRKRVKTLYKTKTVDDIASGIISRKY
jgi:hypothetical protein